MAWLTVANMFSSIRSAMIWKGLRCSTSARLRTMIGCLRERGLASGEATYLGLGRLLSPPRPSFLAARALASCLRRASMRERPLSPLVRWMKPTLAPRPGSCSSG